jgi:carbamoyl-phosphate synthase large subunit
MNNFNILLTSAGRRSYLVKYFKEAIGGKGLVFTTNSVNPYQAAYYSDGSLKVPYASEPEFEKTLLQAVRDYNIRMLFSLHDWEVPYICTFAEKLKALGTIPMIPEPETLRTCLDKYATFLFLKNKGFPSLKTFLNTKEALKAIDRGLVDFPLIIKPRFGQGSIDVIRVDNRWELTGYFELIMRKANTEGFNFYSEEERFIIQEFAKGDEYGLNVLNDIEGNFVRCFTMGKLAMRSGETEAAVVEDYPEILKAGEKLGRHLCHRGLLDADVILTEKGPCVLEFNSRFGGQYPFLHEAGINIPRWLITVGQGLTPSPDDLVFQKGKTFMKDMVILKVG